MFWLSQPPYWRWLAAAAIVSLAAYMDLSGPPTEEYPFVTVPADPGMPVTVEWRAVPRGLLPPPSDVSGVTRRRLAAGTPLVNGLLEPTPDELDDWWAIPVELPAAAPAGSEVLIAIRTPAHQVEGVVVAPSVASSFGGVSSGLVAVPPNEAVTVAAALAERRATILVRP